MRVALNSWALKLSRVSTSTTLPGSLYQRRMACGKNDVLYTVVLVCGTRNRSEWPLVRREVRLRWCSAGISTKLYTMWCIITVWADTTKQTSICPTVIMYHLNHISLRTTDHSLRFLAWHTRTTVYRTSFFPQAIRLWNQLPGSVVEADTLDSFKAQLSRATLI